MNFVRITLVILFFNLIINVLSFGQHVLSLQDPAYQKTEKVYQKMREAAGDFRRDLPRLLLMERVARVASYRKHDNTLIVEKKAFEVCESMGKDAEAALAFLLGHELTHFYQEHDWEEAGFGTNFLLEKKTFDKHVHHEAEADVYGAFIAYLAGYNTLDIIPDFLDKLYTAYQLDINMVNYPSLAERKKVAQKVRKRVEELILIYENAGYFAALGWHAQAIQAYEYLLKFVKTKELYNNISVGLLAMALAQKKADAYWYPLEVDMDNALRGWEDKTQGELLEQAAIFLKNALVFDTQYVGAHINLSIVYHLQKRSEEAQNQLKKAKKYSESIIDKAHISIVEGIMEAQIGHKAEAEACFERAHKYTINSSVRVLAAHNLRVLREGRGSLSGEPMSRIEDMIDGIPLIEYPPSRFQQSLLFSEGVLGSAQLQLNYYNSSRLACFQRKGGYEHQPGVYALHRSKKATTKRGLLPGNSAELVRRVYDPIQEPRTLHYRSGYFLVYPALGLVFKINNQEILEEWGVFISY